MGKHDKQASDFTEESFASKIVAFPQWAGRTVLEQAFLLYVLLRDPDVPTWAKVVITAALAYFVCPLDACPDILPISGFVDDGGVLAGAIAQLRMHVKEGHEKEARRRAKDIAGD